MPTGNSSILPSQIAVRFPGRRCNGNVSQTVPTYYTKFILLSTINSVFSGFFGTKWFHETALALFNVGVGSPTNQTALDSLALQIATDYINWLLTSFDITFSQIAEPTPNGLFDAIEWTYRPGECTTRVFTAPYNGEPEEIMHHDPANAACVDGGGIIVAKTPCFEAYGPPAACSGSNATLTRYKICLIDGRLTQTYVSTDTIS